jgi:hypothetical protein
MTGAISNFAVWELPGGVVIGLARPACGAEESPAPPKRLLPVSHPASAKAMIDVKIMLRVGLTKRLATSAEFKVVTATSPVCLPALFRRPTYKLCGLELQLHKLPVPTPAPVNQPECARPDGGRQ